MPFDFAAMSCSARSDVGVGVGSTAVRGKRADVIAATHVAAEVVQRMMRCGTKVALALRELTSCSHVCAGLSAHTCHPPHCT